jgi:hypothetical protein
MAETYHYGTYRHYKLLSASQAGSVAGITAGGPSISIEIYGAPVNACGTYYLSFPGMPEHDIISIRMQGHILCVR